MYQGANTPKSDSLISPDITTINYVLEWPHLENPSNTTFSRVTQVDICRCPHLNPHPTQEKRKAEWPEDKTRVEPGHFYTRYQCSGPKLRFKGVDDDLWVLKSPHGPINMLQPAGKEDFKRRREIHEGAEPVAYAGKNIVLLTGPCPRGRYQAYATLQYLKSLSLEARSNLEHLSLLIQPYEEDWADECAERSYSELADYIFHNLPSFKALHLNVWDDEKRLRNAASAFSILLHKKEVKIVVGWSWCGGEAECYSSARTFLETMRTNIGRGCRPWYTSSNTMKGLSKEGKKEEESDDDNDWEDVEEDKEEDEKTNTPPIQISIPSSLATPLLDNSSAKLQRRMASRSAVKTIFSTNNESRSRITKEQEVTQSSPKEQDQEHKSYVVKEKLRTLRDEVGYQSDDDWVDVESSPVSQISTEERVWQWL